MPRATQGTATREAQGNGGAPRGGSGAGQRSRQQAVEEELKPTLVFFYSTTSGRSRRVEGFLAQVLQRRGNHATFSLRRLDHEAHADLAARFGIEQPPGIVVVQAKRLCASLERPRGCAEIESVLAPWLK